MSTWKQLFLYKKNTNNLMTKQLSFDLEIILIDSELKKI